MNKIGLGLFIFEVTFILADFSPYRGECSRFGKFDIHIKGKKVNLLLIFPLCQLTSERNLPRIRIVAQLKTFLKDSVQSVFTFHS